MLSKSTTLRLAALVMSGCAAGIVSPASAWQNERVHADSFGNLVIESAAGSKRILVGEGASAKKLTDYTSAGQPHVEYLRRTHDHIYRDDCYRPPVFVKGRSYMYGLSDGEMPELSPCQ